MYQTLKGLKIGEARLPTISWDEVPEWIRARKVFVASGLDTARGFQPQEGVTAYRVWLGATLVLACVGENRWYTASREELTRAQRGMGSSLYERRLDILLSSVEVERVASSLEMLHKISTYGLEGAVRRMLGADE